MSSKQNQCIGIIGELERLCAEAIKRESQYEDDLFLVNPQYRDSARNLIHYMSLREHDIRELQETLGYLGLSRIAKTEGHVLASLDNTLNLVKLLAGKKNKNNLPKGISIRKSEKLLKSNTEALLGSVSEKRSVRIMVTLPENESANYSLFLKMIKTGMNCARINCAHGNPKEWLNMVRNIRRASRTMKKKCLIAMDLGGPKIRTGSIKPGPRVIHIKPEKDEVGKIKKPAILWLGPFKSTPPSQIDLHIPLSEKFLQKIKKGDTISFTDTAGHLCEIRVEGKKGDGRLGSAEKQAYLTPKSKLVLHNRKGEIKATDKPGKILPSIERIQINRGEILVIHKRPVPGSSAVTDSLGTSFPAHISCTMPEILDHVKTGDRVVIDDGKISGIVTAKDEEEIHVQILSHSKKGLKIASDKGLNFPDSQLPGGGLTTKDKEDLKFVSRYADIIELSFIGHEADVMLALHELRKKNFKGGIIIKIENRKGFGNLISIILAAMQWYPAGVMIARGDLAVEFGWKELAKIQEEILRVCEAAHLPVVWATQVLETMAKKGNPSRAEITDAAQSYRAECVMLNKGQYIIETISLLNEILTDMKNYRKKKSHLLPSLIFDSD